jgi:hypothetical protein
MTPDLNPDGPHSPEATRTVARDAAECIRYLNYASGSHSSQGLRWPSDASAVTGSMESLARRLPQFLDQLAAWIKVEAAAGRISLEYGPFKGDPDAAADMVRRVLTEASASAACLHERLDSAFQIMFAMSGIAPEDAS